ncbi:MAG: hypothetical protein ACM3O8_10800 [Methylococcaceae bacterium]|nr:hypothetical protein [Prolixibacteraceae bacterium]
MKKIITLVLTIIVLIVIQYNLIAGVNPELKGAVSLFNNENGANQCEIIKKHPFSRQDKEDTFKLIYNCKNLEDSMSFQIIGFSGDIIYERRFSGSSFYDYGRPWYLYVTDPKRGKNFIAQTLNSQVADSLHKADLQYIKIRMNDFFNDDRFVVNPIRKLDKKQLNVFHYDGISGDSTVVGFKICLFVEGFEMIAYSRKMQKVQFIASAD